MGKVETSKLEGDSNEGGQHTIIRTCGEGSRESHTLLVVLHDSSHDAITADIVTAHLPVSAHQAVGANTLTTSTLVCAGKHDTMTLIASSYHLVLVPGLFL